jgi:DNA-binding transcriptional LysR family regulator
LVPQSVGLVASPAYTRSRGNPKTLEELSRHDCLTVSGRPGLATWILHGPDGREEVKVSGRFRANSARALIKGCLAGLGIALMPEILVATHIQTGRLVHVLPDYRREGGDLNVILPTSQQIPTAVSAFVEFAAGKLESILGQQAAKTVPKARRR